MALSIKIHTLGKPTGYKVDGKDVMGKGTLSVYGDDKRRPIATMYANQWAEVLGAAKFIADQCSAGLKAGTLAGPKERTSNGNSAFIAIPNT